MPRRHSSCASQVQPRRHKVERTGLCFRCACRANQPPITKSLASLGILWSSTDGSCHQGTIKRGCIGRARTATEREDLPQASPPFALRREHSNGATCGSFARRNPGREQTREGGESGAHVSLDDAQTQVAHGTSRRSAPPREHATHCLLSTSCVHAQVGGGGGCVSLLPQRGTRTCNRSGPLD